MSSTRKMSSATGDDSTLTHPLMQGQLDVASSSSTEAIDKPFIYRVPIKIREVNRAAYTPQVISIGPLHKNLENSTDPQWAAMKEHKSGYLEQFLEEAARENMTSSEIQKKKFLEKIKDHAEKIKRCYEETIEPFDDAFACMVLLDAAFIIQLFRKTEDVRQGRSDHKDDVLIDDLHKKTAIKQDLILLENQLPYFILNSLYDSAFPNASGTQNFYDFMYHYFESYKNLYNWSECDECSFSQPKHFTDFVRPARLKKPVIDPAPSNDNSNCKAKAATKLRKAGVQFNVSSDYGPLDVKFAKGELTMPPVRVDDSTERLFRNVMAFEYLHLPEKEAYFCNYIGFMNCLIDAPEDVDLLVERRVIDHRLGSKAALSDLVTNLDKNFVFKENPYNGILGALQNHYKNPWNRWAAFMKDEYFSNWWKATATIVGLMVLILTLITSIYSIISMF